MRNLSNIYRTIKKDYYLFRASECLVEARKYIGTDEFGLWMGLYNNYLDKAIELL